MPSLLDLLQIILLVLIPNSSAQSWTEVSLLTASNKAASDSFGYAVALTDSDALIGAHLSNPDTLADAGSAYVFSRSGTMWSQQAILTASAKVAGDNFGTCVALIDNYALIGASGSDPGAVSNAGAAYVFVRSNTTWTQQAMLTATNKASSALFGSSVAMVDLYGLIGSHHTDLNSVVDVGAAYVFVRSGTAWTQQAILSASNRAANDLLGYSVSLTTNYALAGSHQADPGTLTSAGAAYIFVRSSTTWSEQAILTASDKAANDFFGTSTALSDVYALVGSWAADAGGISNAGAVYAFVRSSTTWTQQQIITANTKVASDGFGITVSLYGDVALIGANGCEIWNTCTPRGKAFIFSITSSSWTHLVEFNPASLTSTDRFGSAVCLSQGYAIVGARLSNPDSITDAGSVYIFQSPTTLSVSRSKSRSRSQSKSMSRSKTRSRSKSSSRSKSGTQSKSSSRSKSGTQSKSSSRSKSGTQSKSLTRSITHSQTPETSPSHTIDLPQTSITTPIPRPLSASHLTGFGFSLAIHDTRILVSSINCTKVNHICQAGTIIVYGKVGNTTAAQGGTSLSPPQLRLFQMIRYPGLSSHATGFGKVLSVHSRWLAVSSIDAQYSGTSAGMVRMYTWDENSARYIRKQGLRARVVQDGLHFGQSVQFISALESSLESVAVVVAVGAPGYTYPISISASGAVFLYRSIGANRWHPIPIILTAPTITEGERFGHVIASDSTILAVGTNPDISSATRTVYIFQCGASTSSLSSPISTSPTPSSSSSTSTLANIMSWNCLWNQSIQHPQNVEFGASLGMSTGFLFVGAPTDVDNNDGMAHGGVYVYSKHANGSFVVNQTILPQHHRTSGLRFGHVLSVKNQRLVIGTNTCLQTVSCATQGKH